MTISHKKLFFIFVAVALAVACLVASAGAASKLVVINESHSASSSGFVLTTYIPVSELNTSIQAHSAASSFSSSMVIANPPVYNRTSLSTSLERHATNTSSFNLRTYKMHRNLNTSIESHATNSSSFTSRVIINPPVYNKTSLSTSNQPHLINSSGFSVYPYKLLKKLNTSMESHSINSSGFTSAIPIPPYIPQKLNTSIQSHSTNSSYMILNVPYVPPTIADLIVTDLSWTPITFSDGDEITLIGTVKNNGTASTAKSFYVAFYVDDNFIGASNVPPLEGGVSTVVTQGWIAEPGNHTVKVKVDYYNFINESNELNNERTASLPYIDHADLLVSDITWTPGTINVGDLVTFNATIKNTGTGSTSRKFYNAFYIDDSPIGGKWINGLFAGNSINVSQTWIATPGSPTIKVSADANNHVSESNETNNDRSEPLYGIAQADIIVANITRTPAIYNDGDTVTFTANIQNIGTGSTSRTFYNTFYIDGSSIGGEWISGLSAGSSISITQTWTATPGSHTFKVIADSNNAVPELNETNNGRSELLPSIEQPDITITDVTWTPTIIDDGDSVTFTATIKNNGGNTNRDIYTRFYMDGNAIGQSKTAGLSSGETTNVQSRWEATPGSYNLTIVADVYNDVTEYNEENNIVIHSLPYIEYPELMVSNINCTPKTPIENDIVTIVANITNVGGDTVREIHVKLSVDESIIADKSITGLSSDESVDLSTTWQAVVGKHDVKAMVDTSNAVIESNETNNELSASIQVRPVPLGSISVTVYDITGSAVQGALVSLSKENVYNVITNTTNLNGVTLFANLSAGNYSLQASASGYQYNSTIVTVKPGEISSAELILAPNGAIIGTIKDSVTNAPISGVEVAMSNGITESTSTNTNGEFSFTNVTPSTYTISASILGYKTNSTVVEVKSGETVIANVLLEPFGSVRGKITNTSGTAIVNASVLLSRKDAFSAAINNTNIAGEFSFTHILPGNYTIQISADDYESKELDISVESGKTTNIDVVLRMMPIVEGEVRSNTGIPVSGALVTVYGEYKTVGYGYTESDGHYRIILHDSGLFIAKASANGYAENTTIITTRIENITTVNFTLTQHGFVNGSITDSISGFPIDNATVYLNGSLTLTNQKGEYSYSVMPGNYVIRAFAREYISNSSEVNVISGETSYVNLSLTPGGNISGTIRDIQTGLPLNGAFVSLIANGKTKRMNKTNLDGKYLLSNIAPENYTIKAFADGYNPNSSAVCVVSYETSIVDFYLVPSTVCIHVDIPAKMFSRGETVIFNVTVTNPAGQPLTESDLANLNLVLEGQNESLPIDLQRVGVAFLGNFSIPPNATIGEWIVRANVTDNFGNKAEDMHFIYFADAFFIQLAADKTSHTQIDNATFYVAVSRYSNLTKFLTEQDINVTLNILDENNNSVAFLPMTTNNSIFTTTLSLNKFNLGNYTASVTIEDKQGNVMNATKVFKVVEDFVVTINTDKRVYNRTELVRIYGNVFYINGDYVADASVRINLYVKGFIRTFYVTANDSGFFEYNFIPFSTEAGLYKVEAQTTLNEIDRKASTDFIILGLLAQDVKVSMSKNSVKDIEMLIRNVGETELTGITASIKNNVQDGVTATIISQPASFIPAGESTKIKVRINASINAIDSTDFGVMVTCDQHAIDYGTIYVNTYPATPVAFVDPTVIKVGLNPGNVSTTPINVTNIGYGVMEDVYVTQPSNSWITVTFTDIMDLNPRESKVFDINIHPAEDTPLGIYEDEVKIISSNHHPVSIYLVVTVSSAKTGSLLFHVVDDIGENVSEAFITLQNQDVGTVYSGTTHSACAFNDIPTGRYSYIIRAKAHDTISGTTTVEPNIIKDVEEILPTKVMDVKLDVSPIVIKDQYFITLNLTFETDVPLPVLLPTPSYLEHSVNRSKVIEGGYQAHGWITIYNTGLISVFNVTIDSSEINTPGYSITFLENTPKIVIDEIKAKSSVTLPYYLEITEGTRVSGLINGFLGKIKIEGEYIYFEPRSDVTHTALTRSEIPVFIRMAGNRELIVDPSVIFLIKEGFSLLSVIRQPLTDLPDINITNAGDENVFIFNHAIGGAIKADATIIIDIVSGGTVPTGFTIYVFVGCISPYQYTPFTPPELSPDPDIFRVDLLKPVSILEKFLVLEYADKYGEHDTTVICPSSLLPLPDEFCVLIEPPNETVHLTSTGFAVTGLENVIGFKIPAPSITMGGILFMYMWQYDTYPSFHVVPFIIVDLNMPVITIPAGSGGGYGGGYGGGGPAGWYYPYTPPCAESSPKPIVRKVSFTPIETVHERVKLSISQEATLERDAFDAVLEMTNKLDDKTIEDVKAELKIFDENGTDATDKFFIKQASLSNIENVNGTGSIDPTKTATVHWTLIPEPGAGGMNDTGKFYFVQALISYTVNQNPFSINSTQEVINVRPQPLLTLDYYIPSDVKANKPFKLAVKVTNNGYGTAKNFVIDSAQPEIYENIAGLLVDFKITGSALTGEPAGNSLKINFGDIPPNGGSKLAWWNMVTTLDGEFTEFSATFTHSNALGGQRTSLIEYPINTHIITREIITDTITYAFLVDSDNNGVPDEIVNQLNGDSTTVTPVDYIVYMEPTPENPTLVIKTEKGPKWIYIGVDDPYNNQKKIHSIVRSDGKVLNPQNYWMLNGKIYIVDDAGETYNINYEVMDTTPPVISNVNATNITTNSATIAWDTDESSDSLVKYGTESENYTLQKYDSSNVTSHSINLTELISGTTYYYVVNSTDQSGNSNESVEYSFTTVVISDITPPESVSDLSEIYKGGTWILWNWTNPSDADFNHTEVWINGEFKENVTTPEHTYNATGLDPNTTYEIGTRTVDDAGNINQTWMNDTAKTLLAADITPPIITNVTATHIASNSATITWDTDEVSDSLVKYGTESGNHTLQVHDSSNVISHNIELTGLMASTIYYFVVNSTDLAGNSNESTEYNFTTIPVIDTTPPASITNLQNTTGQTWINWTWTNPPDTDFSHVVVYLDGIWQANTSKNYYNATGLTPETSYEIGTHTVDTTGNINTTWVNQTTKTQAGKDTTPPSVTNPTATPSSIVADGIQESQLNVTVTDESGIASVTIDLSDIGGSPAQEMNNIPGTDVYTVTTTAAAGTASDTYYLQVNATDIYGNSNTSVSIALTVTEAEEEDTIPPTIVSVTLDAYTTIPDATIHVTVEATDNVGVTSVTADGIALTKTDGTWEGDITAPSTTGDYTPTIRAEDAAGNFAETTVDYSVVKPSGSIGIGVDPRLTTVNAGDTAFINIRLVSTENFDDIAYVYLTTEGVYPGYEANLTWFNWTSKYVKVPAGATVNVPLEVDIPAGESGYKVFYAKLESTKWTPTAMDTGVLHIT